MTIEGPGSSGAFVFSLAGNSSVGTGTLLLTVGFTQSICEAGHRRWNPENVGRPS